jgi:uncharacterized RDD family membrane protein YckC
VSYDARARTISRQDSGTRVGIVTPEGVELGWKVASAGERFSAFTLDLVIMFVVILGLALAGSYALGGVFAEWLGAALLLMIFLITNFYFAFFEIRWRGQTPGKRRVGIRVIDRRGAELRADAVLARNLMRQLELWVPLTFLLVPDLLWPGEAGWARAIAIVWVVILLFLPLFNKERLRAGDLVAGTLVVVAPKAVLVEDVGAKQSSRYAFSREQLGLYGIYELQVLEGLLRDFDENRADLAKIDLVAEKIAKKIRWKGDKPDSLRFLRDFYAAQRAWLEQKLLFGQRREDKHG